MATGVLALAVCMIVLARLSTDGIATSSPSGVVPDRTPGAPRALTYAEGQTIHLGATSIDTDKDLLSLAVTDDGAAFLTFDGALWFTDGSSLTQIGITSAARRTSTGVDWGAAGRPFGRIVAETTGSRLAWLEHPVVGRHVEGPEIVVYDTHLRRRIARVATTPNPNCPVCARIVAVRGDAVFWTDTRHYSLRPSTRGGGSTRLFRDQLPTGKRTQISVGDYQAELRSSTRTIVIGDTMATGAVDDGVGEDFAFVGGALAVHAPGIGESTFEAVTGKRLVLRAPPQYGGPGPVRWFYLFEWLDDDSFALLDATSWDTGTKSGEDILVCRISHSRCTVAVRRPDSAGSPVVPGLESPGTELAAARATAAQR